MGVLRDLLLESFRLSVGAGELVRDFAGEYVCEHYLVGVDAHVAPL